MEYTITKMKCLTTKYGNKLDNTIDLNVKWLIYLPLNIFSLKQLILKEN